jgi:hypothetical protein
MRGKISMGFIKGAIRFRQDTAKYHDSSGQKIITFFGIMIHFQFFDFVILLDPRPGYANSDTLPKLISNPQNLFGISDCFSFMIHHQFAVFEQTSQINFPTFHSAHFINSNPINPTYPLNHQTPQTHTKKYPPPPHSSLTPQNIRYPA